MREAVNSDNVINRETTRARIEPGSQASQERKNRVSIGCSSSHFNVLILTIEAKHVAIRVRTRQYGVLVSVRRSQGGKYSLYAPDTHHVLRLELCRRP